jgi:uncharacterized membrane protein
LNNDKYYIYAVDYDKGGAWGGTKKICTEDKTFTIYGFVDCKKRGHDETGFFQIHTRGELDWTVHLTGEDKEDGPLNFDRTIMRKNTQ